MSEEPAVYKPHPMTELELALQQRDSWKKLALELGPEVERLIHLCTEGATAVEGLGNRLADALTDRNGALQVLKALADNVEANARDSFAHSAETFEQDFELEDAQGYAAWKQAALLLEKHGVK